MEAWTFWNLPLIQIGEYDTFPIPEVEEGESQGRIQPPPKKRFRRIVESPALSYGIRETHSRSNPPILWIPVFAESGVLHQP